MGWIKERVNDDGKIRYQAGGETTAATSDQQAPTAPSGKPTKPGSTPRQSWHSHRLRAAPGTGHRPAGRTRSHHDPVFLARHLLDDQRR